MLANKGPFQPKLYFYYKKLHNGWSFVLWAPFNEGADRICNEELWQGTAKAAEGHLSQLQWAKAKEEGLKVEVNWQDADSSSAKGLHTNPECETIIFYLNVCFSVRLTFC